MINNAYTWALRLGCRLASSIKIDKPIYFSSDKPLNSPEKARSPDLRVGIKETLQCMYVSICVIINRPCCTFHCEIRAFNMKSIKKAIEIMMQVMQTAKPDLRVCCIGGTLRRATASSYSFGMADILLARWWWNGNIKSFCLEEHTGMERDDESLCSQRLSTIYRRLAK